MKKNINALKRAWLFCARPRQTVQLLFASVLLTGANAEAQIYQTSSRTDYVYPSFPTSYNGLDPADTKYLSNASYPSIHYAGDNVFVSGWSSDLDGGFTAGTMDATGNYTGTATVQLLDKIDIQVGFLESSTNTYIVVSYFNNITSNYGFSLYFFNSGTASHIYDYEFLDPTFPNLPASRLSTMAHNRISMDVNRDGDKVAFTMTDRATERMFAAAGMLDAANHRIILNATNFVIAATVAGSGEGCNAPDCPWPNWYDPAVFGIDTVTPPVILPAPCTTGIWVVNTMDITNPLIEIQAQSSISSPSSTIRYKQMFPEVSFSGNNLNFAFYCPGARVGSSSGLDEIYVIPDIPFADFFTQTGVCSNIVMDGPIGTGTMGTCGNSYAYTAHQFVAYHTAGGYLSTATIRDATGGGGWPVITPLAPTGDMRFNMDMPDNYTGAWAITLKNETSPGLNLIEARYNDLSGTNRSVFVNQAPFNASIASLDNDNPDVSYNDAGNRLNLVWGSRGNPSFTTNNNSLIGVVINPATTPVRTSANHYLVVTEFPDLNFGSVKVLSALSKRTAGMTGLYTSFCQTEDNAGLLTFSIFHNQHNWASSVWRTTAEQGVTGLREATQSMSVGPNPFVHSIRLLPGQETGPYSIRMFDQVGRQLYQTSGTAAEINRYFDHRLDNLSHGLYLIRVSDQKGGVNTHKLQK